MKKQYIKGIVFLVLMVVYFSIYSYRYANAVKPDIRYYDKGTKMENGGIEYVLDAKMYTEEEFIEEFNVEKYEIGSIERKYEYKFIVVDKQMTKVSETFDETLNSFMELNLYSKYWQIGKEVILAERIAKKGSIPLSELKVGETTHQYQVFSIASCNLCERLWDRAEEEAVYFEFVDNKTYNYVRRVKILN